MEKVKYPQSIIVRNHSVMSAREVWVYLPVSPPKGHTRVPIDI